MPNIYITLILLVLADVRTQQYDPYNVLGLTPTSSPSQIRQRFHLLSRQYHPDKLANPIPCNKPSLHVQAISQNHGGQAKAITKGRERGNKLIMYGDIVQAYQRLRQKGFSYREGNCQGNCSQVGVDQDALHVVDMGEEWLYE